MECLEVAPADLTFSNHIKNDISYSNFGKILIRQGGNSNLTENLLICIFWTFFIPTPLQNGL